MSFRLGDLDHEKELTYELPFHLFLRVYSTLNPSVNSQISCFNLSSNAM
jgi:hypothetical protein